MDKIQSKRVTLTLTSVSDLPMLEKIEKECDEYFQFDPSSAAKQNRSLRECLSMGDIIPGISEQNYRRQKKSF